MFVSVLKKPDSVYGTTEKTAYRFEEKKNFCNVNLASRLNILNFVSVLTFRSLIKCTVIIGEEALI